MLFLIIVNGINLLLANYTVYPSDLILVILINILAALFLYLSPSKNNSATTYASNYFTGFFVCWGIAICCYLSQIWIAESLSLSLANIFFLAAVFCLKFGFYARQGKLHLWHENKLIVGYILLYGIIQGGSVYMQPYDILFRIVFYAVNYIYVLASCIPLINLKRNDTPIFGEKTIAFNLKLIIAIQLFTMIAAFFMPQEILIYLSYSVSILILIIILASIHTLMLSDVTEQHYLNSIKDELTNIYNRRYFLEQADMLLKRASRHQFPMSLIICDLDKFKLINDSYGHHVGDKVLVACAQALKQLSRETDILARIGGEEFVILLPQTNVDGAKTLAERMRCAISELSLTEEDINIPITASFGISYCHQNIDIQTTLQAADNMLYQAKSQGRNKVCINEQPLS